jgi:hypothetical protein
MTEPSAPGPGDPIETPVDPVRVRRSPDPLLLILTGLAVGVGLIVDHRVRTGLYVCAGSLVAAALLRLVLRPRAAGSLVVRGRQVDVAVLAAAAAAVAALAAVTPFPRSSG